MRLFTRHLQSAKDICPQLQEISLNTMATQQYHSIQRLISNAVQTHLKQEVDRSITAGRAAGGAEMFYAAGAIYSTYGEQSSIQLCFSIGQPLC